MPRFISAHVTTCMTRQDLDRLLKRLLREATAEVKLLHVNCDTVSGRMVCEWEAENQDDLVAWLGKRNVRFRGQEEWCMRVQLESRDGQIAAV